MKDKEEIKILEQQIELLKMVVKLQRERLVVPVSTVMPIVTRDIYPVYPPIVLYYGTGNFLLRWPTITCQT